MSIGKTFIGISILLIFAGCRKDSTPATVKPTIIVCDGNSLTFGSFSSDPNTKSYPAWIAKTIDATVYNKGAIGKTTQQMQAEAIANVDPLFKPDSKNILIAWEIGNDLFSTAGSAENAFNRFAEYCKSRKAATKGLKIIVITVTYRDNRVAITPAGDTQEEFTAKRLRCNQLLRENWNTFSDYLFDLALDQRYGEYNYTYFNVNDRMHLSDWGYEAMADFLVHVVKDMH
jgi:lysophospholipase L1-like esterase